MPLGGWAKTGAGGGVAQGDVNGSNLRTCWHSSVTGVEPIEIPGGHYPMLERPKELADLLCSLLPGEATS
jgi:pimeloyl-ACP methyl ester carboxylesterase